MVTVFAAAIVSKLTLAHELNRALDSVVLKLDTLLLLPTSSAMLVKSLTEVDANDWSVADDVSLSFSSVFFLQEETMLVNVIVAMAMPNIIFFAFMLFIFYTLR
jgi:hypothetical protein